MSALGSPTLARGMELLLLTDRILITEERIPVFSLLGEGLTPKQQRKGKRIVDRQPTVCTAGRSTVRSETIHF